MESVNDMRIKNGLMLLLTAFIWGTAFVAQSVGIIALPILYSMEMESEA